MERLLLCGTINNTQVRQPFEFRDLQAADRELRAILQRVAQDHEANMVQIRDYHRFHGTGNPPGTVNSDRRTESDRTANGLWMDPEVELFGRRWHSSVLANAQLHIEKDLPLPLPPQTEPPVVVEELSESERLVLKALRSPRRKNSNSRRLR